LEASREVAYKESQVDTRQLLQALDDLSEGMAGYEKAVFRNTEEIFNRFDIDGNGVLEGDEYTACIDALLAYMEGELERELLKAIEMEKAQGKYTDLATKDILEALLAQKFKEDRMRSYITSVVDPNNDGRIMKDEALAGFKRIVDDIEEDALTHTGTKAQSPRLAKTATAVGIGGVAAAELPSGDPDNSWDDEDSLGEISSSAKEALGIGGQAPTEMDLPSVVHVQKIAASSSPVKGKISATSSPTSLARAKLSGSNLGSSMGSEEDDGLELELP